MKILKDLQRNWFEEKCVQEKCFEVILANFLKNN